MSLSNFVNNYVKDCPELLLSSNILAENNSFNSQSILNSYYSSQSKSNMQAYIDRLFYDSISRCSTNTIEYEILKEKTRRISYISQTMFDISFSKLLKNKNTIN